MKKIYSLLLIVGFLLVGISANAQKDETKSASAATADVLGKLGELPDTAQWKWGGMSNVQFGQTALVNWAAGGNSQIAVNLHAYGFSKFAKKRHIWENTFDGNWGIVKFKKEAAQINQNLFVINSQYGYKLTKNMFLSGLVNISSPFTKGFDYVEEPKKFITKFAAPMYIKVALGIDYKPTTYLSIFVSPIAGKFTIVGDDQIAALDRYIPNTLDPFGNRYYNQNFRAEFGALARVTFEKEVFKNVNVRSVLEVFNGYTDPNKSNRKNFDIDWQTGIDFKVNDFLAVGLFTHLIYDDNTNWEKLDDNGNVVTLKNPDTGAPYLDEFGEPIVQKTTGVQFREALTIGVTYKFGHKDEL